VRSVAPAFEELVAEYRNTAEHNDAVFAQLTGLTWSDPVLAGHRRYVELNKLGYGDAACHAMWLRLLDNAGRRFGHVRALEIGVFKGQVISLWALIGKTWDIDVRIAAITPLAGRPMPRSRLARRLRAMFDGKFREELGSGNFYENDDYAGIIRELFQRFHLDFTGTTIHRGRSTDQSILSELSATTFHVVYVDGDHTFDGARHDFETYGRKVVKGGWLVADDAGCALPGSAFWNGYETVSRAAHVLPEIGFRNVVNVGHNRVYERVSQ
jgi:Methyltransferase domain